MRISVLGNSDTSGQKLSPGEQPWVDLIGPRLEGELGEEVIVDSWKFAAYRKEAVEYARDLVDEAQPDFAIITIASYWSAFSTVQFGIERRYGQRAGEFYRRLERFTVRNIERRSNQSQRKGHRGRKVARRMLGTGTLLTVEEQIDIFNQVIRDLAARENLQVLVFGDHHFSAELRGRMPGIEDAIVRLERGIRPLVEERRLHWGDLEAVLSAGGDRESLFLPDGVHLTPAGHERFAQHLVPLIAGLWRA
ncbi:MAG: SGNH/GDSL hydrolase family protein [Dehalococcoidia bacterium]